MIKDYETRWRYFLEWLQTEHDFEHLNEGTLNVVQEYISYMKFEKIRYICHEIITGVYGIGISNTTINNINLRSLKEMI